MRTCSNIWIILLRIFVLRFNHNNTLCIGVSGFTIYDTRLSLGNDSTSATYQGRVEVLMYHGWLPLCSSSNWDSSESTVLCHKLGYNYSTYSEKLSTSICYNINSHHKQLIIVPYISLHGAGELARSADYVYSVMISNT